MITQEDEDQARALLRVYQYGSPRRRAPETSAPAPEVTLPDDARFVLRAAQVLRQTGWQGELFLGVKLVDPTWTHARWEQAQAALAQWQQQQAQVRWQGRGVEALGATPDETSEEGTERRSSWGWEASTPPAQGRRPSHSERDGVTRKVARAPWSAPRAAAHAP